jgi:hemerythrin-like domain-containing protein
MDAITMLKDDHASIEKQFKRFEQAGDRALVEKRRIVDRIIEELSVHAAIEEQLFYPVTRATVPAVEDVALESLEEHHIVKWVLSELEKTDPDDERFDAKVTVLIENVRHHVEEEEGEYFPEVRSELGRKALTELGDAMAEARKTAPTRPHPRSPDEPPGNLMSDPSAAIADRVTATVGGIAQGAVAAAQEVVDRLRGAEMRRRPSPTGPSRSRATAGTVRQGANETLERVIATVRETKEGAKDVADTARSRAGRTAKTAQGGSSRSSGGRSISSGGSRSSAGRSSSSGSSRSSAGRSSSSGGSRSSGGRSSSRS